MLATVRTRWSRRSIISGWMQLMRPPPARGPLYFAGLEAGADGFNVRREEGGAVGSIVEGCGSASVHEGDICDSQETEDRPEIRFSVVEGLHGSASIVGPTGGDKEGSLFAGEEAHGRSGGVGEGPVDAGDLVNPELEGGGNGEVMHGHAKDVLVRLFQFRDQRIREGEQLLLLRGEGVGGGVYGSHVGCGNGRDGRGGCVAADDLSFGVRLLPVLDELVRKMA